MMDQIQTLEQLLDELIARQPDIFELLGGSLYSFNGHSIPRVTSIIEASIYEKSLMEWANKLGWQRQSYDEYMKRAADIGTQAHEAINDRISGLSTTPQSIEAQNAYLSFVRWFNDISSRNQVSVVMNEHGLTCEYFGGTVDGVYNINGLLYVIDYKTGNHVGYRYFLQLAAYTYMLEKAGYQITGCIVVQLCKTESTYNEFLLDLRKPDDKWFFDNCRVAFLTMTLWYYYRRLLDRSYDNIVGGGR